MHNKFAYVKPCGIGLCYFMFIIKQLNYKAHCADFDRVSKLIIKNNNDKNHSVGLYGLPSDGSS